MNEDDVRPWIERSPRYLLTMSDERKLRFAPMETKGESTYANLRNMSESGIAFTVAVIDAPEEGDMVKIEFTVPGQKQLACFATVTRVELGLEKDPEWGEQKYAVVALQFRNLPSLALTMIQRSLKKKPKTDDEVIDVARRHQWRIALYVALAIAAAIVIWMRFRV